VTDIRQNAAEGRSTLPHMQLWNEERHPHLHKTCSAHNPVQESEQKIGQGARTTFGCVPTALTRRSTSPGKRLCKAMLEHLAGVGRSGSRMRFALAGQVRQEGGQTLNPLHYPSPLRGWTRSCDRTTPSTEPLKMEKWALVPLSMAEREGKGGVGSDRTESEAAHRNFKLRPISQGRIELDQ